MSILCNQTCSSVQLFSSRSSSSVIIRKIPLVEYKQRLLAFYVVIFEVYGIERNT